MGHIPITPTESSPREFDVSVREPADIGAPRQTPGGRERLTRTWPYVYERNGIFQTNRAGGRAVEADGGRDRSAEFQLPSSLCSVVVDAIRTYADYDSFAREWHSDTLGARDVTLEAARERGLLNEQDTRRLWQLLGLLDEDDVFIQLPEWLVEEKTDDVRGTPATTFVGYISRETEDAVLFKDSSPGRRLMQIAHRIHSLENGVENTAPDSDSRERLNDKLQDEHRRFEEQDDVPYLSDEWLPKSQLITIIQRRD